MGNVTTVREEVNLCYLQHKWTNNKITINLIRFMLRCEYKSVRRNGSLHSERFITSEDSMFGAGWDVKIKLLSKSSWITERIKFQLKLARSIVRVNYHGSSPRSSPFSLFIVREHNPCANGYQVVLLLCFDSFIKHKWEGASERERLMSVKVLPFFIPFDEKSSYPFTIDISFPSTPLLPALIKM